MCARWMRSFANWAAVSQPVAADGAVAPPLNRSVSPTSRLVPAGDDEWPGERSASRPGDSFSGGTLAAVAASGRFVDSRVTAQHWA